MMGGLFTWLIIGVVLYLLFSKRGGMMGCCGGHDHHSRRHPTPPAPRGGRSPESHEEIIDLNKDDYSVQEQR